MIKSIRDIPVGSGISVVDCIGESVLEFLRDLFPMVAATMGEDVVRGVVAHCDDKL